MRWVWVGVMFLLGACGPGAAGAGTARSTGLPAADAAKLRAALAAYDAGQTEAAQAGLLSITAKYPHLFEANEVLGLLLAEGKQYGRALPYLERAAREQPGSGAARANLGAVYLQTGDAGAAVRELTAAAKVDGSAGTESNLGQALMATGKPAAAAEAFGAAVKQKPGDTDLLYNWATALYTAGEYGAAATALAGMPASAESDSVESLAGDIAERRGLYKEAAEHMQAAARMNPSEANIYALTVELLRHWSWAPAIEIAQYGVGRYPESTRLRLALGIGHFGNAQFSEAAKVFSALLAKDSESATYGDLLGRSCAAQGDAAIPDCDSLVAFAERHPGNAQVATFAAVSILHKAGTEQDQPLARRLLDDATTVDPKLEQAWYQLGVLDQEQAKWAESADALRKAIALRPAYAEAHYRLARALSHLHQPDQAAAEIALQQKYSQQEKDDLNAKLKEVTTFLVASH